MRYGAGDSAFRPGRNITYADIMYVAANGDYQGGIKDGLIWWFGTTESGRDIEIAGFTPADDINVVIFVHAMPMSWRKTW